MASRSAVRHRRLAAALLPLCVLACRPAGAAESANAPPPIVLAQDDPDAQAPDDPSSNAALVVRISRLEDRLRTLTGQIEELQFQNRKLQDDLRKMSQDVDFRFQDLNRSGGARPAQKRGDLGVPEAPVAQVAPAAPPTPSVLPTPSVAVAEKPVEKPVRHGDAFDPAADPGAPGAPKTLGTTAPSAPLPPKVAAAAGGTATPAVSPPSVAAPPHAPLDLTPSSLGGVRAPDPSAQPDRTATIEPTPELRGTAGTPGGTPRSDFDQAVSLYRSGQYDAAVTSFQEFLDKNPKDRSIADATYFLGESFARLGRHREAAEQFLKISTDYNRSTRAPDALLRLGVALNALGAKEQACATYQEVDRKYPTASSDVRAGVERELKRSHC